MKIVNTFEKLGSDFFQKIAPTPVSEPRLFLWNQTLAYRLGLTDLESQAHRYFSGNEPLSHISPIALAYSGHQFGSYNPQLGDGRAHLLGEIELAQSVRKDIQLKGSGPTRFSRRGDGRCAMGPAIREFVMSEAMNSLGVPTTQALAVVTTGEQVFRTGPEPGAIVTRIADSHIRVGTFQYHAASGNKANLESLLDYSIERHYPEIDLQDPHKVVRFLQAVIEQQVALVVHWMRVGFIHGVLNTDNTAISGETIDYGPCAMMGVYSPRTVYSSIDENGRYCFGNQPAIMQWNMTRLAESLLPLLSDDSAKAISIVEPLIEEITELYYDKYYRMMAQKIGLSNPDKECINELLSTMEALKLDYTTTFVDLMEVASSKQITTPYESMREWQSKWINRLDNQSLAQMKKVNPLVIPRNHHVEDVLQSCIENQDPSYANNFLSALADPYSPSKKIEQYQDLPEDGDRYYRTFCGT